MVPFLLIQVVTSKPKYGTTKYSNFELEPTLIMNNDKNFKFYRSELK